MSATSKSIYTKTQACKADFQLSPPVALRLWGDHNAFPVHKIHNLIQEYHVLDAKNICITTASLAGTKFRKLVFKDPAQILEQTSN